ncbi:adenine methyltransferase [Deinococcus sp. RL]|nr:adenine methyltransferase [Deinococcus sp. RL]
MAVHYSSEKHDWTTPRSFFDELNAEFNFTLDAAASPHNALCSRYFTEADDGLSQPWTGTVWCNPPYGRQIGRWIAKAAQSACEGATVVMLIPARTDTAAWHDHILFNPQAEVRFVRGRLRFGDATANAPFPSAVIIFRPGGQG